MMCGDPVFIRVRKWSGVALPHFSHFQQGGLFCPWRHGSNKVPDDVRAAQYRGQQESPAHRMLCNHIDAMARRDVRYVTSTVNAYLPPKESDRGRYPDVAVTWRDFPEFVVEVQLSRTFQTEISARCTHYEREGVALIWVLYGCDPRSEALAQSFLDVVRRHRGNAFVIDRDSVAMARERNTIVLNCYLQDTKGKFESPRLVTLDDLVFPQNGTPYLEDRLSSQVRARAANHRQAALAFLRTVEGDTYALEDESPERKNLLTELRKIAPALSHWNVDGAPEIAVLRLIEITFSIVAHANGKPRNYATKHTTLSAMLNTMLNGRTDVQRFALLLEFLLERTPLKTLLNASVGKHIARAKKECDGNLCLEDEPEWDIMRHLIPEIFDPIVRNELLYLSSLPEWASEPHRESRRAPGLSHAAIAGSSWAA